MNKLELADVVAYVEEHISNFHQKRISTLGSLKLSNILKRKNPYLFKAKNVLTAEEIVKGLVDAHLSSNEETIFGDWLEGLAIFICEKTYGGWKSTANGIDLELEKEGKRYIVSIKSGPNWGNSSQIKKMRLDFTSAQRTLRTSNSQLTVVCINGCCYGKDNKPDKGDYFKYCGQDFWEFISGDKTLYTNIIEPLGHKGQEKNNEFYTSYSQVINKFTREFANEYCNKNGEIEWDKLVRFNSGSHIKKPS